MSDKCWMYHKTEAPTGRLFDAGEVSSLASGWVDTPAKFKEQEKPKAKPKAKAE